MIIHREVSDEWNAYKMAKAMDKMGHKVVAVVCKPAAGTVINVPERWHVFSQGDEVDTDELDRLSAIYCGD